jgi:syntaxin 1B/2/3
MAQYGGYNQGGGYGQSNPYAQQTSYGGGGGGGGQGPFADNLEMDQYDQPPAGGRYGGGSGPRPGGASGYDGAGYNQQTGGSTGGNLLNQCRDIDQAIDDLGRRLQDLQRLQNQVLNDRASNDEIDRMNSEVMSAYKNLGERLKKVKSNPESGSPTNAPQVGRVDRKLKKAINDFQRVESDFRRQMQDAQVRQYRIVNPEASPEDARMVVEDPKFTGGVFEQAVGSMNDT